MNGFEIRDLPGKGRALFAIKYFATGDTIFEEEPFVSCQYSWNADYGYSSCDHCLRPLETTEDNIKRLANNKTLNLPLQECCPTKQWITQFVNCENCNVRYCCEDCHIEANKKYHRVACLGNYHKDEKHPINILNEIWKKMHYPPETGTIMLIVRLMAMYKQAANKTEFLESLQSFHSMSENTEFKIYHKMLGKNFENEMELLYSTFCEAFSSEDFANFRTPEAFKALMAMMGTNAQGIATSPWAEWTKAVSKRDMNDNERKAIDEYIDDTYNKLEKFAGEFLNNEGSGLYVLQSKINHSCKPNAQSEFPYSNDIVVLKAIAPIEAGEEICISYLDECVLNRSRHTRRKILSENYIFLCECLKCVEQASEPDITSDEESDDDMEMDDCSDDMDD